MDTVQLNRKIIRCTDEQLVHLIQQRKSVAHAAFTELVRRHRVEIFRRCVARLGHHQDADDVVQESLIRAYHGLSRFRGDSVFRTWLFSIVDNQCNTLLSARARRQISDHLRSSMLLFEESRIANEYAGEDERHVLLRTSLDALPEVAREVLLLRFWQDLSLNEISRRLEVGLSAVKMRLYRAMDQLEAQYHREVAVIE